MEKMMNEESPALTVISLGWGVQSWALAAMSALGVLPPVDYAIHSDTTYERSETYAFAEKWTPWLEERGVKVVTVTHNTPYFSYKGIYMPVHTTYPDGQKSGMLRRQCTDRWKIAPVRRFLRAELKRRNIDIYPSSVEQWLGITLDEFQRMKDSKVKYVKNIYPFIEQRMARHDVVLWLLREGLEVPVKSSCVMCPFHDRSSWREIKETGNGDWSKAIAIDNDIRNLRPGFVSYVCEQRLPLKECDFSNEEDHGQMTFWEMDECEGGCFL
jgi:hypothetical protein